MWNFVLSFLILTERRIAPRCFAAKQNGSLSLVKIPNTLFSGYPGLTGRFGLSSDTVRDVLDTIDNCSTVRGYSTVWASSGSSPPDVGNRLLGLVSLLEYVRVFIYRKLTA